MKKYFLVTAAIVCAIAFSSFTKPFTLMTFKLKSDPVWPFIVSDNAKWSTSGQFYGVCLFSAQDLACKIQLDNYWTPYFHTAGGEVILNTFTYANAQSPKQDYLQINEGLGTYAIHYIIGTIQPMHYNVFTQQYETDWLGVDLSFTNAQE